MKKLFAMILAVAMVLSLASVAMAEYAIGDLTNQDPNRVSVFVGPYILDGSTPVDKDGGKIPYGETVYFVAIDGNGDYVKDEDVVKKIKIKANWEEGKAFVGTTELVKVSAKWGDSENKIARYAIAIATKDSTKTGTTVVDGKMDITSKDKDYGFEMKDEYVTFELGYDTAEEYVILEDKKLFKSTDDDELEFTTEADDDVTFTVDMTHQSDIVLSFETDEIDEVVDAYPAAGLDFYVFNNATFKKTGELFIPGDEGTFLYQIKDGKAVAIDAKYDKYDEGFYLKTKTLGVYVVSDIELKAAATATTGTTNPGTGAIA